MQAPSTTGLLTLLLAISSAGCAAVSRAPDLQPGLARAAAGKASAAKQCSYDVTLRSLNPAALDVTVECTGFTPSRFVTNDEWTGAFTRAIDAVPRSEPAQSVFAPESPGKFRYAIDLEGLAARAADFDIAERVGNSFVLAMSTALLSPEPANPDVLVRVRVHTPPGLAFVSALEQRGSQYELGAHEIRVASYAAFGDVRTVQHVLTGRNGHSAALRVAVLGGRLSVPAAELDAWIYRAAEAVARFWGGFPVASALVVVIPRRARSEVVFGKVLPESSPGIALVIGEDATKNALARDWILVHELFHLGSPSFSGEGKWLDEGLATYFEPLIRVRAGLYEETAMWAEFLRAMPQGLHALKDSGLENVRDYRSIYWGGALVCLQADVSARVASHGAIGLEDGMRAVLAAGGNASEVWPLDQTIQAVDQSLGRPILSDLARRDAQHGAKFDLDVLWRQLGVRRMGGRIELSRDAERAALRHALVYGSER